MPEKRVQNPFTTTTPNLLDLTSMEHELQITTALGTRRDHAGNLRQRRSGVITVKAETSLRLAVDEEYPDSFEGKLLGMTPEQFGAIKFGENVEAGFGSKRYRFTRLEPDGTFELRKVL